MTVIQTGDDAIMLDAGIHLPAVIKLQESESRNQNYSEGKLRNVGALPNDLILDKLGLRNKVRAILLGHAHLDHIGAVPYIGQRYNAPVVGTPFTTTVLKKIMQDDRIRIPNKIKTVEPNATFIVKGKKRNYEAEFINMTHSTIQTTMMAVHTPEGIVLYANDFKLDNTPVMGMPPNYKALRRIAKEGVKALVVDSLYSSSERKTPSEKIARHLLEEVLLTVKNENSAIFIATFSSHIARLKSIVDYAKKLNRKIYFIGRSLKKYVSAAIDVNMCPFKNDFYMGSYKKQVESILKKVSKDRANSLVVCTGHQGEPGSILDRIARKQLPFSFESNDNIIFSSKTIPTPINIANKKQMDGRLRKSGTRLFDEVHVSGHGGREDLRDLLSIVNPEHIIPSHGSIEQLTPMVELSKEMGWRVGKECHLMGDGKTLKL